MKFLFYISLALILFSVVYSEKNSFAQQSSMNDTISVNGSNYVIPHSITSGKILAINADTQSKSIIIDIQSAGSGSLTITLPRIMIDAKNNGDATHFIVLANKHGTDYKELISTPYRTLTIPFPAGTNTISITGTQIVPEYGMMPLLILTISVFSLLVISRFRTLSVQK